MLQSIPPILLGVVVGIVALCLLLAGGNMYYIGIWYLAVFIIGLIVGGTYAGLKTPRRLATRGRRAAVLMAVRDVTFCGVASILAFVLPLLYATYQLH